MKGNDIYAEWCGAHESAAPAGDKGGKKGDKGGKKGKKGDKGGKKGGKKGDKGGKKGPPSTNQAGYDATAVGGSKETFSDSD